MKINIEPEVVIPAKYEVYFYEFDEYEDYIIQRVPYKDELRSDIVTWLNENADGFMVSFDRGDFGEGPAVVKISFTDAKHATEFVTKFNNIPCPDALSINWCQYRGEGIRNMLSSGSKTGECSYCGKQFKNPRISNNG